MSTKKRSRSLYLINEPNWATFKTAESEVDKTAAYKYADYFVHYEISDKLKIASFYKWVAKSTWSKNAIQKIKKLPDYNFVTAGKFAYIHNKLGYMPQQYLDYLNACLPIWLTKAENILEKIEEANADSGKKPNIQDYMREQVSPLCEQWDLCVDLIFGGTFDIKGFDPHREMLSFTTPVKAPQATIIRNEYLGYYDEAKLLYAWEDEDIREAYRHTDAKTRKTLVGFYEKIISACDVLITTQKSARKSRKPKAIDKGKTVSKLKFQVNDPDLGIASINPIDVVGANEVWIYNTKTRKIGVYYAETEDPNNMHKSSLTVKGTSLRGFDAERSRQKTLRKPKEQLPPWKGRAKSKFTKAFDEVKAIDTKMNGRFADTIIILRAF